MIKERKSNTSLFLQYMTEAPGDETPRRNMKVVNLKTRDGRRPDYSAGADVSAEDDENIEDDTVDTTTEEPTEDTSTDEDFSAGADNMDTTDNADDSTPEPDGDEPVTDDSEDFSDGADAGDAGADGGEDSGDADMAGDGDEPVTDDSEDFSDGADAGDAGADGGEDSGDTPTDTPPADGETQDTPAEQLFKYNLYRKFEKLLLTLKDYIDDLEMLLSDDPEINQQYRELSKKLNSIKELMEEYMIVKYPKVSFAHSMLFYQRVITSVNIILDTLRKIRKNELKNKS